MIVSSRWCVTAVVALGALACSDPVPPPAQGAFIASVNSVSPTPAGKMCPSGAATTFDVPSVLIDDPTEDCKKRLKTTGSCVLDADTYVYREIDGSDGAEVSCKVHGSSTFTFSGRIALGGKTFEITDGTLDASKKGFARITIGNSQKLSSPLSAPSANCIVNAAAAPGNNFQVKAGSMWASYSCPSVEHQPSDYCKSDGFFVLENCSQ
jgi:hypothetical protein